MEHPCLVKLLGVMEKMPKLLLVTELMLKGSLWDYYHREKRPTPHSRHMALVLDQAIDMADGMEYLHDKKILHRDLKSQNIWLDENLKCKIGDFGMSRLNTNKTMTLCGSPLWCSPEILRSERYSFPADVFSFAIILWEAFHWAEPYTELTVMEIIVAVTQRNERPDISPMVPEAVQELIRSAWHAQPEKRPMMGFLLSKPAVAHAGQAQPRSAGRAWHAVGGTSTHVCRRRRRWKPTVAGEGSPPSSTLPPSSVLTPSSTNGKR